jgi:signal peptidase I
VLNFRVDGESMLPNLDDGEMLLVNRNAYQYVDVSGNRYYPFDPPERGDVIVFDPPTGSDKPYIKRIIGLPGEEVTFGDGNVFINGELLPEDYIQDRTRCGARSDNCDVVVPEGYVYVLGDHRSNSSDSRVFGPVPVGNIVGKAWVSYWPVDDVGFVPHESYTDDAGPAAASVSSTP